MDELEKFIKVNKSALEQPSPNRSAMWNNIESRLPQRKPKNRSSGKFKLVTMAATFIALLCVAGFIFLQIKSDAMHSSYADAEQLHDIDSYYSQLIDYQVVKIKSSSALSEDDKIEFLDYFKELDKECKLLQDDLKLQLDNEEVVRAIVDNYRQRLTLLENLLNRLDQKEIQSDEKSISL